MIGSIIGDIIGSIYEFKNFKNETFEPLFRSECSYTDDSILTVATARAILDGSSYASKYKEFGNKYKPEVGRYGSGFRDWLKATDSTCYNSYGNGSAMRVSPVGFAFNDIETVLEEAKKSAECSHNHPEGIKGAQATALAILMARNNSTKEEIKKEISSRFDYNLNRTCDEIRPNYKFDSSCQGTVPEAIIAFIESNSYENAVRKAISLGGDSDTMACITGGIAQAFYKEIPKDIVERGLSTVPEDMMKTIEEFNKVYCVVF